MRCIMKKEVTYDISVDKLEKSIIFHLFELSYFDDRYSELDADVSSLAAAKRDFHDQRVINLVHSLLASTVCACIVGTMDGISEVGLEYGMYAATAVGYIALNGENRKEYKSFCNEFDNKYEGVGELFSNLVFELAIYCELLKDADMYNFESPVEVVETILFDNKDYVNSLKMVNKSYKSFNFDSVCQDIDDYYGLEDFNKEIHKRGKKFVRVKSL